MSMKRKASTLHYLITAVPRWFIALFALTYITGYTISFLFYSGMGIPANGSSVLKLQYIYIGIIFFMFASTFVVPFYLSALSRKQIDAAMARQREAGRLMSYSTLLGVGMLLYFFSVLLAIIFTPSERASGALGDLVRGNSINCCPADCIRCFSRQA